MLKKARIRAGGPLGWVGIETPFTAEEVSHGRRRKHIRGLLESRLKRGEQVTRYPLRMLKKKFLKEAPKGPISSIGSSIAGTAVGIPAAIGGAALGGGPATAFTGGLVGGVAGYEAGSRLARKALTPLDKKLFAKQIKRSAKIRASLEKYRGA
jgi:hypothetical protein